MSCKPGVAGSIPGFSQSVGWDFKPLPRLLRRFKTRTTAGWAFGSSWTKNHKKHKPTRPVLVQPRKTATKISFEKTNNNKKQTKQNTVKPVLSGNSNLDKTHVLKADGSLMQVKSIADSVMLLTCFKQ